MTAVKISATIITYNEERNIERCIRSIKAVADEIVVVDSYSTDKTKEICQKLGVRIVEHDFAGYVEQKNYALTRANHDYVLALDADEALSDDLREAILNVKSSWTHDSYRFNRLTNYCGHWVRHCGWYPDTKLRLWDRRKGQWGGTNPHDSVKMAEGTSTTHIKGDLLHYSYYSPEQHMQQIDRFTTIAAQAYRAKGKRVIPVFHLFLYPILVFFNRYILKRGFLDGTTGLIICRSAAFYKFLKYAKLHLLYRDHSN